ncbi:unnamed protein product [Protopolystoma xenopodis]|uniref:Uncharacterized protein n=1 Tax=Protopolystoma xenopodis TaxID=117903 RepID=A0A3S4ZYN7_9PLAT|nr:unnamed protein product [Protopolystoma xenopodis]
MIMQTPRCLIAKPWNRTVRDDTKVVHRSRWREKDSMGNAGASAQLIKRQGDNCFGLPLEGRRRVLSTPDRSAAYRSLTERVTNQPETANVTLGKVGLTKGCSHDYAGRQACLPACIVVRPWGKIRQMPKKGPCPGHESHFQQSAHLGQFA